MVDKFTEYIKRHSFSELDDEEGVDILAKSAKEKANFKLRQFKRCGWLEEDNSGGFSVFVSMTDNAIALMETFKNLISKRNRPLEYTGYFYVIYETLRNFDYQKSKALIEQVVKNTTELFNHLQGLHSTIKDYISKLMVRKDLKPQDILDLLRIYEKYKIQYKIHGVGLVNSAKIQERKVASGSLAEKIVTESEEARRYVMYLMGDVMCVDSEDDLKRHERAITRTVMVYQNKAARQTKQEIYATPYIGRKGRRIRLEQVRMQLFSILQSSLCLRMVIN